MHDEVTFMIVVRDRANRRRYTSLMGLAQCGSRCLTTQQTPTLRPGQFAARLGVEFDPLYVERGLVDERLQVLQVAYS